MATSTRPSAALRKAEEKENHEARDEARELKRIYEPRQAEKKQKLRKAGSK